MFSYIGRQPIYFDPEKVTVTFPEPLDLLPKCPKHIWKDRRDKFWVIAKGPFAQHAIEIAPCIQLAQPEPGTLNVNVQFPQSKEQRSHWGTSRSVLYNLIVGVSKGWEANLKLVGVGYRVALERNPETNAQRLHLRLGYSHPVLIDVPSYIVAECPDNDKIKLRAPDLKELNKFAFGIRKWRKPEPYNQKGIFVNGETIEKKKVVKT